jgi:hypothetical protein
MTYPKTMTIPGSGELARPPNIKTMIAALNHVQAISTSAKQLQTQATAAP